MKNLTKITFFLILITLIITNILILTNLTQKPIQNAKAETNETTNEFSTQATINGEEENIFFNWQTWHHSEQRKAGDNRPLFMKYLAEKSSWSFDYRKNFIDVNGDGLLDILSIGITQDNYPHYQQYAIWINEGNTNVGAT